MEAGLAGALVLLGAVGARGQLLPPACVAGEVLEMPEPQWKITAGTYQGECVGYCDEELVVTPDGVTYASKSRPPSPELPDRVVELPAAEERWGSLLERLDWGQIAPLPERVGDPDAADQGGEFVEIEIGDGERSKRVEFEPGRVPEALAELVEALREVRRQGAAALPP